MADKLQWFIYPRIENLSSLISYMYSMTGVVHIQVRCEASSVWPRGVVDSIMVCGTIDPSSILGGAATEVVT